MPSVEELLNQDLENDYADISPINDVITIDPETRTINLPASETLFGTEQEMDVERKYFKCPKIVGDNIDLSKHQIYIMYITAQDSSGVFLPGEGSEPYYCKDMAVDETGNYITFSWLLSGNVLSKAGFIAFAVCAKHMDGEVLKTRWKTKPAVGTVLLTVPDGASQIVDTYPDIIAQLLERMDAVEDANQAANTAIEDLPNEYYMLTSGTAIPGNADMDTYKTPGNYYIKSAPTSSPNNVQNAPFTRAFTLKVEFANGTDDYIMQTYRVWNTGEKAVRVFSDNAWGAYEYFSSDDALVTEKEFDALYTNEKTIAGAINSLIPSITPLTSRDNLNNITTPGRYSGGGWFVPNSPFSGSYDLEVIRTTDGIAQSFFCTDTGERAFRLHTDGSWSEYAYFRADATVFDQVEQSFPDWIEDKPITSLATADRTVAGGINELLDNIGVLMALKTDAKTNLVSAINEVVDNMFSAGTTDWASVTAETPSCLVSFSADAALSDGFTIPKYSKGIYIKTAGGDAIILAYGIYYELYAAFRNNGVWIGSVFTDDAHLSVGGVEIVTLEKAADSEGFTINAFAGYAAKQGRIVTVKINARITTNSAPFNEKLCSVPEGFLPYSGATGSALVGKAFMSIGGAVGMANIRNRDGFLCMTYETDNLSALDSESVDINLTYLAAE